MIARLRAALVENWRHLRFVMIHGPGRNAFINALIWLYRKVEK